MWISDAVILAPAFEPLSPLDSASLAAARLERGPIDARFWLRMFTPLFKEVGWLSGAS